MVEKVKRGDLVLFGDFKCLISTANITRNSGTAVFLSSGEFQKVYYDSSDLKKAKRLKVSQVPKKLAELRRQYLKY